MFLGTGIKVPAKSQRQSDINEDKLYCGLLKRIRRGGGGAAGWGAGTVNCCGLSVHKKRELSRGGGGGEISTCAIG